MKTIRISSIIALFGALICGHAQFDGTGIFFGEGSGPVLWNEYRDSTIIYSMNLRTGSIKTLWADSGQLPSNSWGTPKRNQGAFLTADGKQIVFAYLTNLMIMNNDGTGVRKILSNWRPGSWCLTGAGVFWVSGDVHLPSGQERDWKVYKVDLATGNQTMVYHFTMPICPGSWGTDITGSLDGQRFFTRADIIDHAQNPDCGGGHAHSAFMTFNPDFSLQKLDSVTQWGHMDMISNSGKYVFMLSWDDYNVHGLAHKYAWIRDHSNQTLFDTIQFNSPTEPELYTTFFARCTNNDSLIGVEEPTDTTVPSGDALGAIIMNWAAHPKTKWRVHGTPSHAYFGSIWQGTLPATGTDPVLVIDKRDLVFNTTTGAATPESLTVVNSGPGTLAKVSITKKSTWLTVTVLGPANGSGNTQVITNTINASSLADGIYRDTINISATNASNVEHYYVTLNKGVLASPSSLIATAAGDSLLDVTLGWTDNTAIESGFAVERSTSGGTSWTEIGRTAANATTYLDIRPGKGAPSYRVRAFTSAAYSAYSNIVNIAISGISYIDMSSPVGGETWQVGTVHSIRWTANGINSMQGYYSTNDGRTWNYAIDSMLPSSTQWGNFPWTVPNTPSSTVRFKLQKYGGDGPIVTSETFTIGSAPVGTTLPAGYIKKLLQLEKTSGGTNAECIAQTDDSAITARWVGASKRAPCNGESFTVNGHSYTWNIRDDADGMWSNAGATNYVAFWSIMVLSPDQRSVKIGYRIDDDIWVWRSGVNVHSKTGWDQGSEQTTGTFPLDMGENRFLLKMRQNAGGSLFAARFLTATGSDISDLKYDFPCPSSYTGVSPMISAHDSMD